MLRKIVLKVFLIYLLFVIFVMPSASAEDLPESDHSYANNFEYTWPAISDPEGTQMRFHFAKLDLADDYYDELIILDEYGNELKTYRGQDEPLVDKWTAWYTGNKFRFKLDTDEEDTGYGFKVDQVEIRTDMAPSGNLPESYHSYANNFEYIWPAISDPEATQMRFHFVKLDLADDYYDELIILDEYGNELKTYRGQDESLEDVWTSWYTGNKFRFKLDTDEVDTGYGFKIDEIETRTDMAPSGSLPESYHPYANNFEYTWPSISDPNAAQMRFHFVKLDLADDYYDELIILDEHGNELKTYKGQDETLEDVWTEWYTGNEFKIQLDTDEGGTGYGFTMDQVEIREIEGETRELEVAEESSKDSSTTKTLSSAGSSVEFSVVKSEKSSETAPEINMEVTRDQDSSNDVVFLSGSALSDSGIKSVTINGIYVDTESWNVPLDLSTGDNTNVIVATGYDGSTTIETINIYNSDPDSNTKSSASNSYLDVIITGVFAIIAAAVGALLGKKKRREKEDLEYQEK